VGAEPGGLFPFLCLDDEDEQEISKRNAEDAKITQRCREEEEEGVKRGK